MGHLDVADKTSKLDHLDVTADELSKLGRSDVAGKQSKQDDADVADKPAMLLGLPRPPSPRKDLQLPCK